MTANAKKASAEGEPAEGSYRCTECGDGAKLWAYAGANVYGPLAASGSELAEHLAVEEWGIHQDSIQCEAHPGATLESFVGGRWCRWWSCPKCHGGGKIKYGQFPERTTDCGADTPFPRRYIGASGQTTVHEGWLPAEEHAAATGG